MDYVTFGNTGLRVSRLGIGTGTHGWAHRSEQTALGIQGLAILLKRGFELGVNFWDTADQYGAHPHVAAALRQVPRDKVVIATKTTARRAREATRDIERFLKELHTDVIDIVLLHGLSNDRWPQKYDGAMEALSRAKEAGKVRAIGFSCHSLGTLQAALGQDWVQVILVRLNYAGVNMDGTPAEVVPVIKQLYHEGKAIYAMKVLGCGRLTEDPHRAFSYVLGLGCVHALTVGMTSLQQLEENVRHVETLSPDAPLETLEP